MEQEHVKQSETLNLLILRTLVEDLGSRSIPSFKRNAQYAQINLKLKRGILKKRLHAVMHVQTVTSEVEKTNQIENHQNSVKQAKELVELITERLLNIFHTNATDVVGIKQLKSYTFIISTKTEIIIT